jgi:6-bladed beta-propeller
MRSRLFTVAVLAVVAACAGDSTSAWQGSITDSAGIAIVRNPAEPLWGPGEAWTFTEALRIGTAEGEPEYQFGMIAAGSSIVVASDGRVVVLDMQGQHLKVFTATGTYERTIGGPGGGPGEIAPGASAVLIAPGDTLVVSDIGNQRANLYLLDGTFVRSFSLSFAEGIPFRWEVGADGRIVNQIRRLNLPGTTGPVDTTDVIAIRHLDGSLGDTLMRVPSGRSFSFSGGAPEFNLFTPEPLWALWGNRVLYAVNDQFRISVYGAGGALERVIERPVTRAPVTDADENTLKDLFRKLFAQQAPPEAVAQLMSGVHVAEFYPAFAQMLAGPNGTILVQRIEPLSALTDEEREALDITSGAMAGRDWDVLDAEGRYLGVVTMPLKFQPIQFRGNEIYGTQSDELDVQYVVKLVIGQGEQG